MSIKLRCTLLLFPGCAHFQCLVSAFTRLTAIINKHHGEMHNFMHEALSFDFCVKWSLFCYCLIPTRWSWHQPASTVHFADLFVNCDVCNLAILSHEIKVIVPSLFELGVRAVYHLGISCHK